MKTVAFFRADDAGALDANTARLIELFEKRGTALSLAVIPTRATDELARAVSALPAEIIDVHQHGYAHEDHPEGGEFRGEFAENRTREEKRREITAGFALLEKCFGDRTVKIFTPPWGAMDAQTYAILREEGYTAISAINCGKSASRILDRISRRIDPLRFKKYGMTDLSVAIDAVADWKDATPKSLDGLITEFERVRRQRRRVGIMLHAHMMHDEAFAILDGFLAYLQDTQIPILTMGGLLHTHP